MELSPGSQGLTVLIADDDEANADHLCRVLGDSGIRCRKALGAHRAFSIFNDDDTISVIVANAAMKQMGGTELARLLKDNLPKDRTFEMLLVADRGEVDDVVTAMKLGIADYLIRPLEDEKIVLAVKEVLVAHSQRRARKLEELRLINSLKAAHELNSHHADVVSMVSHELRTPLAVIDASAQRMLRRYDSCPREEIKEKSDRIRGAVARLVHLIDRNLASARIDVERNSIDLKECDVRDIILNVASTQRAISHNLKIKVDLDSLPDRIPGNPKLLEQVFTNLVANAVKYSPRRDEIRLEGTEDDGYAVIRVIDYGIGISAAECDRVFEKFYRAATAKTFAGSGIGLNLTRDLVRLHGGEISVKSEVGRGSTFTVKLPLGESDSVVQTDLPYHDKIVMNPPPQSSVSGKG